MARMVNIDRATPMLLPPDLRDWVPDDDMVHFVIASIEGMSLPSLHVNRRGTGSAQYPPRTMLALLVYCYANGIFSSRRIEHATYRDVAVRFLMANTHPDHDTICTFRRKNLETIGEAFLQILQLAKTMGLLKVGAVSVDGTHIRANASKNKNVQYDRAAELEKKLKADIDELLKKAEEADNSDRDDGQRLPEEINRREKLLEKMQRAQEQLKAQANARAEREQAAYQRKVEAREKRKGRKGRKPIPPDDTPRGNEQTNLTDPDSRLMRKSKRDGYTQSFNAQAVVDADGSMLILNARVTNCASDANELLPAVDSIDASLGQVSAVLADSGYMNADAFEKLEGDSIAAYVAIGRDQHTKRQYDFRPTSIADKPGRTVTDPRLKAMVERIDTDVGRAMYRLRKQTVEPVFGIVKSVMGFRSFRLRGSEKVAGEWNLVALAFNVKRLAKLAAMA